MQSLRSPPSRSSAPSRMELLTTSSMFNAASLFITGPISVDSSIGFPIFSLLVFSIRRSMNSSATLLSRMILLTPQHIWPENVKAPVTASSTAFSISASSRTINGSFPPSSRVSFLLAAWEAIYIPVATLPVNEILAISGE